MTSLVERLRAGGIEENEAADEIERLQVIIKENHASAGLGACMCHICSPELYPESERRK